ncbi:hypothetical protein D3C87_1879660 [compost metagenome]
MVAELVADQLPGCVVAARRVKRPRLHHRNALLVVHHVQRLALQGGGVGVNGADVLAEDLEAAEVDALFGKARRFLPHLAHALA